MAKDPAVLFYTSDFLTGTMLMTDEQVGKYIRLLCLQHQKGKLTDKDMLFICKSYDKDIYEKFTCLDGLYYNERMLKEHEKRSAYSKSRSDNRTKGIDSKVVKHKETKLSYVNHMENENENEDININKDLNKNKEEKKQLFYPFSSSRFLEKWKVLLSEKKWKVKSFNALQASLYILSKHSEEDAIQMMDNTIAGGWKGLFELNKSKYSTADKPNKALETIRIINNLIEKNGNSQA